MSEKIIVSNETALRKKYGSQTSAIQGALERLIVSDATERGLKTTVIYMDNATQMAKYKTAPVTNSADAATNEKENKNAIDGLYSSIKPDYIMILGGPDIVPLQTLDNPANVNHDPELHDPNLTVPSDLPYACDVPYSSNPGDFTGPTRVVGRMPDITGKADASYLSKLIDYAVATKGRPKSDYAGYFGVTAEVWEGSTTQSLTYVFGNATGINLAPPGGPDWDDSLYANLSHFVNCHGGQHNPNWFGQDKSKFSYALFSGNLSNKIKPGTVASAECCYGAQLYDPHPTDGPSFGLSICNTYLLNGAIGFFGSTTIAYGSDTTADTCADLLTRSFFLNVLNNMSLGRSVLEARHTFVTKRGPTLGPTDLKTLCQYILLGDPSVQPVASAPKFDIPGVNALEFESGQRNMRRRELYIKGKLFEQSVAVAVAAAEFQPKGDLLKTIHNLFEQKKGQVHHIASYRVARKGYHSDIIKDMKDTKGMKEVETVFHLVSGKPNVAGKPADDSVIKDTGIKEAIIMEIRVDDGNIVSVKELHTK